MIQSLKISHWWGVPAHNLSPPILHWQAAPSGAAVVPKVTHLRPLTQRTPEVQILQPFKVWR